MSEGQPTPESGNEAAKRRISHDALGNEYVGGEIKEQGKIDPREFDEKGVPGGLPRDAARREIIGATRKMKKTDTEEGK